VYSNAKSPQGNCSVARFELLFHTVSHFFYITFGTSERSHQSAPMECSQLTVFGCEEASASVLGCPGHEGIASTLRIRSVHATDSSPLKTSNCTVAAQAKARASNTNGKQCSTDSYNASSAPGSERLNQCCRKQIRSMTTNPPAGGRCQSWDNTVQSRLPTPTTVQRSPSC
jgi:hypothetical protein